MLVRRVLRGGRFRRGRLVPVLVLPALTLAGCQSADGVRDQTSAKAVDAVVADPAPAATVTIAPGDGATGVPPEAPVLITTADGALTSVELTDADGNAVRGDFLAAGMKWRSLGPLRIDTKYTVVATAVNVEGKQAVRRATFQTLDPERTLSISRFYPEDGSTVGAGMPISLRFEEPVEDKAAVERALTVTTTPVVAGAWHWFDDQRVDWRPRWFWPTNTKVAVRADLMGVNAGGGRYGTENTRFSFTIADRSILTVVDAKTRTMTIYRDGRAIKTFPTTTGASATPTWGGYMVIMEKHRYYTFDSETVGFGDEYYYQDVPHSMRITPSGTFVHAAPWSVWHHGKRNVSHGCIGLSPSRARWLYDRSIVGDVVRVINTEEHVVPLDNGFGDWNLTWKDWLAGSALRELRH